MKRVAVRLSILVGVVVLGLIAIAHAQRGQFNRQGREARPAADRVADTGAGDVDAGVAPFAIDDPRSTTYRSNTHRADAVKVPVRAAQFVSNAAPEDDEEADEEDQAPLRSAPTGKSAATESDPREPRRLAIQSKESQKARSIDPFGLRQSDTTNKSNRNAEQMAAEESEETPLDEADDAASDDAFRTTTDETSAARAPRELPPPPSEGTGKPGAQHLEGSQAPNLTIEKTAPAEIQIGKPAVFTIKVRNTGKVPAQGVEIHDIVPKGTQLVATKPPAAEGPQGDLVWTLGMLKPSEETTAQLELMPIAEGEIGSVATVIFHAEASVRTIATRPQLALAVTAPEKAMIGSVVNLKIKISNPGSGAATGVVLTETIPQGLKHAAGSELEFEVGTLKPGESRELDLALTAAEAGSVTNALVAVGDGNLRAEDRAELEVVAPALKVAMTGPKKRYLERNATYNISISNPGTAAAKDIELVTILPKGLKFVEANNAGQYDAATHSVYWSLQELPANQTGSVTLTALPVEAGDLKLQIKGRAQQGLSDQRDETISVEGLAALQFELVDVNDPIEVNGETTYEVKVTNQGSKAATNVRVAAILPDEMKAVSAGGPVKHTIEGQRVVFQPLSQLAPKADTTYSIKVKGLVAGDLRIKVQLVSDEIRTPITKEESTRVYSDE